MFLNKVEICGVNTSELPLLSDEEKENLFIQIEQGNMDAREQYVKGNLRLVLSVIQRFSSNHEHADDLFQVGCIGLMKAIDNFETCYQIALKNGQYDRAIFVLKQLNELYLDHGLQNKLRKVKELQENFYKMSYANQIIEDIGLKLN